MVRMEGMSRPRRSIAAAWALLVAGCVQVHGLEEPLLEWPKAASDTISVGIPVAVSSWVGNDQLPGYWRKFSGPCIDFCITLPTGHPGEVYEPRYSLLVQCTGGPCEIREKDQVLGSDRVLLPRMRGRHYLAVWPRGDRIAVTATIRYRGRTHLQTSPLLRVVAPSDFLAECWEGAAEESARPCGERELRGSKGPWIRIRPLKDGPRLAEVRLNGQPGERGLDLDVQESGVPLAAILPGTVEQGRAGGVVGSVVDPGEYRLMIEVSPAPFTIHREITLRVR